LRDYAESIVKTVRHPLVILNADLQIEVANPQFYRTFQVEPAATEGCRFYDLWNGQWSLPALQLLLEEIIPSDGFVEDFLVENDFAGIGVRIFLLNARRVERAEDHSFIIVLAIEDVTDRRHAAEAIQQLNEDLEIRVQERTAQLAASAKELEAFCYSVSHDLRTPLRAISGFSQELLRKYTPILDDTGVHYLKRVCSASQRMAQLIDDLLQLSRIGRADMRRVTLNLTAMAHEVGDALLQRDPQRTVTFKIEEGLTGQGDPNLLQLVLENLFENAWKFTGKKPEAIIEFGEADRDGCPAYFVRDNGAGFDMEYVGKLFGAFQRLHSDRDFPGTGIGLANVQRIIHRHRGTVWAEGVVGEGATFHFTLGSEEKE
jgi:signal transduction histidine kinase